MKMLMSNTLLILSTYMLITSAGTENHNSKRAEIERELYKNVLPYINLVKYDAERAKEQIIINKQNKRKKLHGKKKLLKELDKKVLPWLDELTKKGKSKADGKTKDLDSKLQKMHNRIHGPSALNTDQEDQIGKLGHDINLISLRNNQLVKQKDNQKNIMIKQEKAGEMIQKQDPIKLHEFVELNSVTDKSSLLEMDDDQSTEKFHERGQVIESEVAELTNQIAEFQEQINKMTNDEIFPDMSSKSKKQKGLVLSMYHEPSSLLEEIKNKKPFKSAESQNQSLEPILSQKSLFSVKKSRNFSAKQKTTTTTKNNPTMSLQQEQSIVPSMLEESYQELSSPTTPSSMTETPKNTQNQNKQGSVKIIFGGNIGFDGIVRYKVEAGICTYNESFNKIKQYLSKADHVVMSLDSPFQYDNKTNIIPDKKLADDVAALAFGYAGIDTVVLANDHILDYGPEAATYTAEVLRQTNTLYSGFTIGLNSNAKQEPVIYATNGVTVGLLSYCMNLDGCAKERNKTEAGPAIFNEDIVKEEVTALRESGIDIVIIYLHWGDEDDLLPLSMIKEIIRKLSDVKIDAIVGSHPHADGHYFYRDTLVVLTLGTFLTPMHIHVYKSYPGGSKSSKLMNRFWSKQKERWEMPSLNSKLLQIEVDRDGLIPFKSKYLPIRMGMSKDHCLQPERTPKEWWIPICTKRDKQCLGSTKCNSLECNSDGSL